SPLSTQSFDGERRTAKLGGTVFLFYYDGSNIYYRYSIDNGKTWTGKIKAGAGTGVMLGPDNHRWTIASTRESATKYHVTIFYFRESTDKVSTEFYGMHGVLDISKSPTKITWDSEKRIFYRTNHSSCASGHGVCPAAAAASDTSGNIYVAFRYKSISDGYYYYRIYKSSDRGATWPLSPSLGGVRSISQDRIQISLTRLPSGDMLFVYTTYSGSEIGYRTLYQGTWQTFKTTNGANMLQTYKQISADSDGSAAAYVAFTATSGSNSAALKVAKWTTGNPSVSPTISLVGSTLSHSLPSVSATASHIYIHTLASGKIYRTDNSGGTWGTPTNPFGTSFSSPNSLTSAVSYPAVVWTEGSSSPYTIRYGGILIDLTEVRNKYGSVYEIPGEPSNSNTVDIKYVISAPGKIKIDIVDDATGSAIATTNELTRSVGTYTWSPIWPWKSTPDSYRVVAYWKDGFSTFVIDENIKGFVQADKLACSNCVDGWSPNMYTRAERGSSHLGSDYTKFKFYYWYWDNSVYNPDQGT
ncbi:MAG: hypothetical protein ACREBU_16750, partial [Nitrososphaera sp.]